MRSYRKLPLSFFLLLAIACGGPPIESDPGPVYLITVENPMSHPMNVWYDDGMAEHELGRLGAGEAGDFVIAAPASTTVELIARDEGRTHTITRRLELGEGRVRAVLSP